VDVSLKEDLGYEAVMGIINRYSADQVDWLDFYELLVIGIDEIALKKGHKDYVTIVTGRIQDRVVILGVLKDRKKATVKAFFYSVPSKRRMGRAIAKPIIPTLFLHPYPLHPTLENKCLGPQNAEKRNMANPPLALHTHV
jgi:Transposase.